MKVIVDWLRGGTWQLFLAGLLCGTIFTAFVGTAAVWWKPWTQHSAEDDEVYDACLASKGNTIVQCDAMIRILRRVRMREASKGPRDDWQPVGKVPISK
jgi:hypothetical protein